MEKKIYFKPLFENEFIYIEDIMMASNAIERSDQSHSIYNSDIKI